MNTYTYTVNATPADSAKILTRFSKDNSNLKILGGIMGNEILDVAAVKNVATLPTLD